MGILLRSTIVIGVIIYLAPLREGAQTAQPSVKPEHTPLSGTADAAWRALPDAAQKAILDEAQKQLVDAARREMLRDRTERIPSQASEPPSHGKKKTRTAEP